MYVCQQKTYVGKSYNLVDKSRDKKKRSENKWTRKKHVLEGKIWHQAILGGPVTSSSMLRMDCVKTWDLRSFQGEMTCINFPVINTIAAITVYGEGKMK